MLRALNNNSKSTIPHLATSPPRKSRSRRWSTREHVGGGQAADFGTSRKSAPQHHYVSAVVHHAGMTTTSTTTTNPSELTDLDATSGYVGPRETSTSPKQIVLIVLGAIVGLTGLLATVAGGAVLVAIGPPNTIQSSSHGISSSADAVVSAAASIHHEAGFASVFGTPTIHVHVTTAVPGGAFIGIAPVGKVDRYLAGTPVAVVNDFNTASSNLSARAGRAMPAPPNDQSFWVAHATGTAAADLVWTPRDGTYRVVVMRADGKPGINL